MTADQYKEYQKKKSEMKNVANTIENLPIDKAWVTRFTKMAFYRGWRKITEARQKKLTTIAEVDSPSVATIIEQKHTKIGTDTIERIASIVTEEKDRARICNYLLTKSWREAKKDTDLIISHYQDKAA